MSIGSTLVLCWLVMRTLEEAFNCGYLVVVVKDEATTAPRLFLECLRWRNRHGAAETNGDVCRLCKQWISKEECDGVSRILGKGN